jgi:D-alanine transaminase
MPLPTCYLNGEFQPLAAARVSPLDRAFLFGDAVYEVIPVYGGRPFRLRQHLDRLNRSLDGIRMAAPFSPQEWLAILLELIRRNGAGDQYLYVQVSRGAASDRSHAWPEALAPTLFAYASALEPLGRDLLERGVAALTAAETRWARRDIKSTALLANVLLKKLALEAGAFETIMLENGFLTEGSSTTVHVVQGGAIHTPANSHAILPGTTRDVVLEIAGRLGLPCVTAPVSAEALRGAEEIWLAFSTRGILPVTRLDGAPVANGRPGALFARVHQEFLATIANLAGTPAL